jgi:hypothetical protein
MVAVSRNAALTIWGVFMSQLVAMFCDIDDFCKVFEPIYTQRLLQNESAKKRGDWEESAPYGGQLRTLSART